jgi:hypothetical protein
MLALGFVIAQGCNRGPAVAEVRGKVLYKDGTPIKGGVRTIRFEPAQDSTAEISRVAGGTIENDGSFELQRRKPGDGVYLGKYKVVVTVWKGAREPISLIKDEYTQSATTPFEATIEGDTDDLLFELEPLSK